MPTSSRWRSDCSDGTDGRPAAAATRMRELAAGLVDLVYPPVCAVCGAGGGAVLCDACRAQFEAAQGACVRCGAALGSAGYAQLCPACERGVSRRFSRIHAAGVYGGPLRGAILALKYGRRRRLAEPLGEFLAERLGADVEEPSAYLLIPVPLHPSRFRERGFNQSELLARVVGSSLGCRVERDLMKRVRRTKPQASLPAYERAANILGAFAVPRPERVAGRRVLLVDDVVTTMSTVNECARVLADAGVAEVRIAAVARGG